MTRDGDIGGRVMEAGPRACSSREQLNEIVDRWLDTGFEQDEVQGWLAANCRC